MDAVEIAVARDEIRQLAYRYSAALASRDVEAMVELYSPEARFGPWGEGPEALRRLTTESLQDAQVTVVLVANHLIDVESPTEARGEVWARSFSRTAGDGYVEQLLRYEDRYRVHEGAWRFLHRRHRLWFGVAPSTDPFAQAEAGWPERQVGVGDLPLDDPRFATWWQEERRSAGQAEPSGADDVALDLARPPADPVQE